MSEKKLFSDFPPVPTAAWEEVIAADLKGADYHKKLVWQTGEGFEVRPYYRAEDLEKIDHLGSAPGEFPYVRGTGSCNCWKVHQTLRVGEAAAANAEALRAIAGGADSIGLCVPEGVDMEALLKGVDAELVFCGKGKKAAAEWMIANRPEAKASFDIDPIVDCLSLRGAFSCCGDGSKCFSKIAGLVKAAGKETKMRFATIHGQHFGNSGSTIVQELAFTLAAGHDLLVKLMEQGLSVDQAARTIRFSMSVSANYFMEIAKLRAARMLWAKIVAPYKPACDCSSKMYLHAVTSRWNLTLYDPYVNMLRGTTEAMSAALGGVHSLEVLPFDAACQSATAFSSRIARNVQLLLKHESHFDRVVDPAGGSYYIETLTASIAEQAGKLFQQVEERGGYIEAFQAGFIQQQVGESAAQKEKAIATRRQTLLGTNQFPNFTERKQEAGDRRQEEISCAATEGVAPLKLFRGAEAFEAIRQRVDGSGRAPKAFMLTCGALAFARARAQFSCNFFACAGIEVIDNVHFASIDQGVKAAVASKAEIVVICAADDDYATLAPEAFKALGGKAIFVVAGAPASQSELEAQGITNFISVRSNVLETLKSYLEKLGI